VVFARLKYIVGFEVQLLSECILRDFAFLIYVACYVFCKLKSNAAKVLVTQIVHSRKTNYFLLFLQIFSVS
jgi:hypothetical protein